MWISLINMTYNINFLPWKWADDFHLQNLKEIENLIWNSILDIWCWVWRFYNTPSFIQKNYLWIDLSKTSIDFCRNKYKNIESFINVNILDFKTIIKFSFILDIGCIHLIPPTYHKFLIKKYIHLLDNKWVMYMSFFNNYHKSSNCLFFLKWIPVYWLSKELLLKALEKEGKILKTIKDTLNLEDTNIERITIVFQKKW